MININQALVSNQEGIGGEFSNSPLLAGSNLSSEVQNQAHRLLNIVSKGYDQSYGDFAWAC
jgi:hypothetical protein